MTKSKSTIEDTLIKAFVESVGDAPLLFDDYSVALWKEDDRKWFEHNTKRSFRLRKLMRGEFPDVYSKGCTHCIVRQIIPGFRDKLLLSDNSGGQWYDDVPNVEEIHLAIWLMAEGAAEGESVPVQKIKELAFKLLDISKQAGVQ